MSAAQPTKTLFEKVVTAAAEYMGPAANRFILRHVRANLNKEPSELTAEDVVKLAELVRVEVSLFTEDAQLVDDFTASLLKVTQR